MTFIAKTFLNFHGHHTPCTVDTTRGALGEPGEAIGSAHVYMFSHTMHAGARRGVALRSWRVGVKGTKARRRARPAGDVCLVAALATGTLSPAPSPTHPHPTPPPAPARSSWGRLCDASPPVTRGAFCHGQRIDSREECHAAAETFPFEDTFFEVSVI